MSSLVLPETQAQSIWPRIGWGIFLLCFLVGMGVAAGAPVAITFGLASSVTALIAWRFPFPVFNIWIALSMLLGILVGIYTGEVRIGERVFSAYVELAVGEVIALGILAAWAFRILTLWRGRNDRNWEPWLPLLLPFLALIGAHILSGFSEGQPAWGEVVKFVGRYLVFVYLTSIALVVNFVRSKKRLRDALLILFLVGIAFALDGLRNMISFDGGFSLNRAMPGPILEVNPLGGNQHSLAEVELIAIACGLALAALLKPGPTRRYIYAACAFMTAIVILTFSRTAWIVVPIQLAILFATIWRDSWKTYRKELIALVLIVLPLAGIQLTYSLSRGAISSIDSRAALTQIAVELFKGSPFIGVGAGTFVDRVAHTYAFTLEFGPAFDAHGLIWKVMAETGLVGLVALALIFIALAREINFVLHRLSPGKPETIAYMYLLVGVIGMFAYELTSTTYWTPRLWLPIGLLLAAGRVFLEREAGRDPDFLRGFNG
jgi:O-antigen ligase